MILSPVRSQRQRRNGGKSPKQDPPDRIADADPDDGRAGRAPAGGRNLHPLSRRKRSGLTRPRMQGRRPHMAGSTVMPSARPAMLHPNALLLSFTAAAWST
jgi:hypothetical protein